MTSTLPFLFLLIPNIHSLLTIYYLFIKIRSIGQIKIYIKYVDIK